MNITQIRAITPGTTDHIHLNNAGSSLPTQAVLDTIQAYLQEETKIGGYTMQAKYAPQLQEVYQQIAQLIHCSASEIAMTSNASSAFTRALHAIPWKAGDTLVTSRLEYGNNYLSFLFLQEKFGIQIRLLPHNSFGSPDVEQLPALLDDSVKLVAITHMPANSGVVADAAAIGRITRKHGIPFLLDACQTVGQIPVDVEAIGCDMLSATSRKYLRGPRGLGFLYVREKLLQDLHPPFLDMNAAVWTGEKSYDLEKTSKMFEEWEKPYALLMGLGTAVAYFNQLDQAACWQRIQELAAYARDGLEDIKGVQVHDKGKVRGGIIGFTKKDADPEQLKQALQQQNITTSVSYASSSLLDMKQKSLTVVNRASLHYFNTYVEIDAFLEALSLHP